MFFYAFHIFLSPLSFIRQQKAREMGLSAEKMYVRNWKTANKKALRINGTPLFLQETVYTFSSICQIFFSDIFWHLGMCKMLCVCLSIRSYFIHDTFKKLSFAHHAKFIFPLYTSKCQKCCRNISLTPNTYVIFSVF